MSLQKRVILTNKVGKYAQKAIFLVGLIVAADTGYILLYLLFAGGYFLVSNAIRIRDTYKEADLFVNTIMRNNKK
jgi:hypothetical protein